MIDVVKTNNSAHSMNLSPTNNPAEYYDMKVRLEGVKVEETADLQKLKKQDGHRVTSFMLDQLKPGKSMKETVEMSAYHGMTQPGIYTICFHQSTVSSNIAIVTVTR